MKELLICALRRHGTPATAATLVDSAIALAQADGWPQRSWARLNPQMAAGVLKSMHKRREVLRDGYQLYGGVERPLWAPVEGFDAHAPMPPAPAPDGEDHPLHGTTMRQKFVLFDVLDASLTVYARMNSEVQELVHKHQRELSELSGRVKRELLAAGLQDAG
jgi:hypothetical protein